MNAQQALEYSMQPFIPMFIYGDYDAMESERQRGEEALKALIDEWNTNENPNFSFDTILTLADQNRELCDQIGEARLRNLSSPLLARSLSDADTCTGIGKLQHRAASAVAREVRGDRDAYSVAYVRKPIKGTVLGLDIETTGRAPERGYIINVGWELMELTSDAVPTDAEAHYCGIPEMYRETGVPLENIHHIQWSDLEGQTPFRQDVNLQKTLLKLMKKYPYMAHNAAFEDSWFMLHLPGYAEARKAGKIIPIDTRHICRSIDGEVRTLPRESAPASLENWARRRGTLAGGEVETHLGLDDTDLMLRTVQAEFNLKNMFAR
ncbi:3'-5' exonuclease [Collinsella provencensis]|uniref:3'-5' exonuclease n=1 Tax=Collinsella provencensis TaxID=1937461 RepID=UPI000C8587DB|nr:DNA polymerase III subunit epsilon [Collinsella provencensis]